MPLESDIQSLSTLIWISNGSASLPKGSFEHGGTWCPAPAVLAALRPSIAWNDELGSPPNQKADLTVKPSVKVPGASVRIRMVELWAKLRGRWARMEVVPYLFVFPLWVTVYQNGWQMQTSYVTQWVSRLDLSLWYDFASCPRRCFSFPMTSVLRLSRAANLPILEVEDRLPAGRTYMCKLTSGNIGHARLTSISLLTAG